MKYPWLAYFEIGVNALKTHRNPNLTVEEGVGEAGSSFDEQTNRVVLDPTNPRWLFAYLHEMKHAAFWNAQPRQTADPKDYVDPEIFVDKNIYEEAEAQLDPILLYDEV